ncbi:SAM-dependent methyltransferase [Actinoplanes sp. NPDC048988]|uniref:SAM-dependent methyltransferase n=1 Tax=Actinoplanes sp. NPDC048988 TaxID=3363901 RepID=UPI00371DC166
MTHDAPKIDTSVSHPARRYNYWLGGKDNFAADRGSADAIQARYPDIRTAARENRRFLQRTVRYLTGEAGIRQFLDIGTGLPTADNTHEVAQQVAPASRIVYVDNDPLVMTHARALLTSDPEGRTDYIEADLREPHKILSDPKLHEVLDLEQPVALMLVAVLHFLDDDQRPHSVVRELLDRLAPGSYLVASHATGDFLDQGTREQLNQYDFVLRSQEQFSEFFTGLELIEPGIGPITAWRPDSTEIVNPKEASVYGAVARVAGPRTARAAR